MHLMTTKVLSGCRSANPGLLADSTTRAALHCAAYLLAHKLRSLAQLSQWRHGVADVSTRWCHTLFGAHNEPVVIVVT